MKLYKIKTPVKENGLYYYDLYLGWWYNRAYYERVSPTFKGFSKRILYAHAIEVKNVASMKEQIHKDFLDGKDD